MKRFWVTLLVLGLIGAFSTTVLAVDVKVSGEFFVAGMYLDHTSLQKDVGPSTAFYYQRLRVKTDFSVAPGLTLITRFDALDRSWGATRATTQAAADSAGTRAENENIAIDFAYVNYKSPIGTFDAGLMEDGRTGTVFGNSYGTLGRIKYAYIMGPVAIKADITKGSDSSYSAVNTTSAYSDADKDKYGLEGVYSWRGGTAGMKVTYYHYADKRPQNNVTPASGSYLNNYWLFTPYVMAKIGPVDIQAEVNYASGYAKKYEEALTGTNPIVNYPDVRMENLSAFLDATVNFKPVYFGSTFAYISGDDPGSLEKQEGGVLNGGRDWNPCLIMFNYWDRTYWAGTLAGFNSTTTYGIADGPMSNAWFFQVRGGVKPIDALDIMASVSYASADKKPTSAWLYNDYGYEVDLTATYKITNNLSYMLGAGYLFTGKYYRGTSDSNEVANDYMLINKLTLVF